MSSPKQVLVKPARLHFARTARALRDATYIMCERGVLSEFRCRFTTYRHRFARVAPAPRVEQSSSKNSWTRVVRRGRASPVKNFEPRAHARFTCLTNQVLTQAARAAAKQPAARVVCVSTWFHLTRCLRTLHARLQSS